MPRPRLLDYMQNYPFWLLDVSPTTDPPFFVLLPILGFQSITAPEMTAEMHEITPGNSHFKEHKILRASVNSITLSRGAQFWDADYWRWIHNAVIGKKKMRRDLMLIHYTSYAPATYGSGALGTVLEAGSSAALGVGGGIAMASIDVLSSLAFGLGIDVSENAPRIPGRLWSLRDCLPTRYKVASDFDATSADVSLMELEVQPKYFEEISLAAL